MAVARGRFFPCSALFVSRKKPRRADENRRGVASIASGTACVTRLKCIRHRENRGWLLLLLPSGHLFHHFRFSAGAASALPFSYMGFLSYFLRLLSFGNRIRAAQGSINSSTIDYIESAEFFRFFEKHFVAKSIFRRCRKILPSIIPDSIHNKR